jgi:hypothetical protein
MNDNETYRLLEVRFNNDMFDEVEVLSASAYAATNHENR